jgi:hypothetical protein
VTVSLAEGTAAGAEIGLGFELGASHRHAVEATAGIGASIASGRSWTLPDAAAARAFVARYGGKATLGGEAVDLVRSRCSILCDAIGWRPHAELPPPDELYMSHGGAVKLGAELTGATLRASAGALLGTRLQRDGSSTSFLQLDELAATDLVLPPVRLSPSWQHQTVLSYRRDARRRPLELMLHTVARGGSGAAMQGTRAGWRAGAGVGGGLVRELDARLDLRDPQNRVAASALLAALRHPLARAELRRHAATVRERIARTGVVDRRTYALSSSAFELGAKVALGAQFGGSFGRTRERMRLLRADTRLPGLPFLPRDDCRVA